MISRCHCVSQSRYADYGGRGIQVCERWRNSFESFVADLPPRPSERHSLDRIDNNGNYEPGNVRWATAAEQARNRRDSRLLTLGSETLTLTDWTRRLGLSRGTIQRRLRAGWSDERTLSTPPYVGGRKLSRENAETIRGLLAQGVPPRQIARRFGVTPQAISAIKLGRAYGRASRGPSKGVRP